MKKYLATTPLTIIAALFHCIGLGLYALDHRRLVILTTPWHLLLMFLLVMISFKNQWKPALKWIPIVYLTGFAAEWIGVHKGWLFGNYHYSHVLGAGWQNIPYIIGVNWVIVVAGAVSLTLLATTNKWLVCILAATIATAFDWILEPVAIKMDYWQWAGGHIPLFNYVCWWILSFLFAWLWQSFKLKTNQFAINLVLIQVIFFAVIRSLR